VTSPWAITWQTREKVFSLNPFAYFVVEQFFAVRYSG